MFVTRIGERASSHHGRHQEQGRHPYVVVAAALCAARAALPTTAAAAPGSARARRVRRRDEEEGCLDCHQEAAKKFASLKRVHAAVKENKVRTATSGTGSSPPRAEGAETTLPLVPQARDDRHGQPNVHKVLRRGACTQCHDPHGSNAAHMLKAEGGDTACHDRKKFERKNVHAVMTKEGCRACYVAHASEQPNPVGEQGKLCTKCHSSTADGFRRGSYPVATSTCSTRHDPHSSDKAKLLKASVHDPVAQAGCDSCREAARSKRLRGHRGGREALRHATIAKAVTGGRAIQHEPVKKGECVACHDPRPRAPSSRSSPGTTCASGATRRRRKPSPCRTRRSRPTRAACRATSRTPRAPGPRQGGGRRALHQVRHAKAQEAAKRRRSSTTRSATGRLRVTSRTGRTSRT